jgi:hypothetical protein
LIIISTCRRNDDLAVRGSLSRCRYDSRGASEIPSIALEPVLVIEVQGGVLVLLAEDTIDDHQHFHVTAHKAAEGVLGRADDRLVANVVLICTGQPVRALNSVRST